MGEDGAGGAEPAGDELDVDAVRHHVHAGEVGAIAPVEGGVEVERPAAEDRGLHLADVADGAVFEQAADGLPAPQVEGGRHKLGDEIGARLGGGAHLAGLGGVHGHARLAEDVLACFEGGDGEVAVHVGPGADADGVDVGGGQKGGRVGLDAGDAELLGDGAAALLAAVADRDELDLAGLAEAGNVTQLHVAAGADEADAQGGFVRGHGELPSKIVWINSFLPERTTFTQRPAC